MKISYKQLRTLIHKEISPSELDTLLTDTGLEVEGIEEVESIKGGLKGMVIGEVLTCQPHPDADRLQVTTVAIGQDVPAQIVCGAKNVAVGQKVVVATVGATLYPTSGEPFVIKKSKIRGVASEGMICAEDEIGLGHSHEGILVLDTDLPNGTPAADYFGLESDYCIEIGLTPNRADAASHVGVARDLKAVLQTPVQWPSVENVTFPSTPSAIQVKIEDADACPRFCGLHITQVEVKESPTWLKNFLGTIGVNSINNLVDISNYICHYIGQPMHIFDAKKIIGGEIRVKKPEAGTKLITLDGVERTLTGFDLAICHAEAPMALAGIFGGEHSGVTSETTEVFLEVAYFNPAGIRKSATHHGLKTDASFRYERGTDPMLPPYAIRLAAAMVQELAGGVFAGELVEVYPTPLQPVKVACSYAHIDRLIGIQIPKEEIRRILRDLDFTFAEENEQGFTVEVPLYRVDVTREADVIEEIIRIHGFEQVHLSPHLASDYLSDFPVHEPDKYRWRVGETLVANGFFEIQTLSIVKPAYNEPLKAQVLGEEVALLNPLSEELSVLRQSLLFSGLESLVYNINRRQRNLKFFEFGRSYYKVTSQDGKTNYKDQAVLGLWMTGNVQEETWNKPSIAVTFYDLLEAVQKVLRVLKVDGYATVDDESGLFQYGLSYQVRQKNIVRFGMVKPQFTKLADCKQPVFYAEFDWNLLLKVYSSHVAYQEIPKYPEVRRDLSLVLDSTVRFQDIFEISNKTERKLIRKVHVFDVYEGDKLPEGKKAYSVSFLLQDAQQTLTDQVIDKTMQRLMAAFEEKVGAVIRK